MRLPSFFASMLLCLFLLLPTPGRAQWSTSTPSFTGTTVYKITRADGSVSTSNFPSPNYQLTAPVVRGGNTEATATGVYTITYKWNAAPMVPPKRLNILVSSTALWGVDVGVASNGVPNDKTKVTSTGACDDGFQDTDNENNVSGSSKTNVNGTTPATYHVVSIPVDNSGTATWTSKPIKAHVTASLASSATYATAIISARCTCSSLFYSLSISSSYDPTYYRLGPNQRQLNEQDGSGNMRGDTIAVDNTILGSYFDVDYYGGAPGWVLDYTHFDSTFTGNWIDGSIAPPMTFRVSYPLNEGDPHQVKPGNSDTITFLARNSVAQASVKYTMNFHDVYEDIDAAHRTTFPDIPADYTSDLPLGTWKYYDRFDGGTVPNPTAKWAAGRAYGFTLTYEGSGSVDGTIDGRFHTLVAAKIGAAESVLLTTTQEISQPIGPIPNTQIWAVYYADSGINADGTASQWGEQGYNADVQWQAKYTGEFPTLWHIVIGTHPAP